VSWVIGMIAGYGLGMMLNPLQNYVNQIVNQTFPINIPGPDQVMELRLRNEIDEAKYHELMKKWGYSEEVSDKLFRLTERLMSAEAVIMLWRRGVINEAERNLLLRKIGIEDPKLWIKATEYYPSPTDVIRFAVREVFTPSIAARYGLYQDIPPEYYKWAEKVGLPKEIAEFYWAAHWNLPSATQGYEMLHRGIITEDELKTLLRALDVMPYWRDKLIKISYNPIPRVDIRRMYDLGFLKDEELEEHNRFIGLSPEDAKRLTLWIKANRYLTDAINYYKLGLITLEDIERDLRNMGVPDDRIRAIKLRVKAHKKERVQRERDLTKSEIVKGVKNGILTWDQGVELLQSIGYDRSEAEYILTINLIASKGDPEVYSEMLDAVVKYRLALGLPAKPVPKELIEAEKEYRRLKELYEKEENELKKSEIAQKLAKAEARFRKLLQEYLRA